MQSLPTFNPKHAVIHDQACELRSLIARRVSAAAEGSVKGRRCHTIAIAGGKGGVGKSVLAVNLAIALAKQGSQVGLFDASPHLGQVEMLCGISRYWNLSHVTRGGRRLEQVVQKGPAGVHILAGGSGLIQQDLVQSHPVIIMFTYETEGMTIPNRWAMIDGINRKGELHVDFPRNTTLHTPGGEKHLQTGYYPPSALIFPFYKTSTVTSLHYKP
jgi:hypothetical protein